MTREEVKAAVDRLMCHLTYPELDDLHALDDADAELREEREALVKALKRIIDECDATAPAELWKAVYQAKAVLATLEQEAGEP